MQQFVFSQATLEKAIDDWVARQTVKYSEKETSFLIVKAALPWLLEHLNQLEKAVCSFNEEVLLHELDVFARIQIKAYPCQKTRIDETCALLIEFFNSDIVDDYKMIIR